jgi:hypothetical protein
MDLALAEIPMKKFVIGLVVAGILVLLGVLVFKRSGGPSQAAALAPGDSVAFVNIPNIPLTGFRWTRCALAKIAAEPEVQAFMELPLKRIQEAPGADETGDLLKKLKPGNIFLSVLEDTGNGPRLLVGVQFWGKREDFDNAVTRLREAFPVRDGEAARSEYRGLEILATRHGDLVLFTAAAGRWGFLASDEAILHAAIDRATGNHPGDGLSQNPEFLQVVAELPKEPDLLAYARMDHAVDQLLAAGNALGATPVPSQVEKLKSTRAIGAAWKIDGNLQRDALFLLRPGTSEPAHPLTHQALELTHPGTLLYFDFHLNLSSLPDLVAGLADIHPAIAETLAPFATQIANDYGPECALLASWPQDNAFPSPMLALQIQNPDAGFLSGTAPWLAAATARSVGGRQIHVVPSLHTQVAAAQNDRFLVLGTDPEMLAAALDGHPKTLRDSPAFQTAKPALKSANEAFCYLDTRTLFERAYGSLLPVIRLSAAMMPDLATRIDVSKLPKPETIGQHLPPIVLSQRRTAEGTRLESSGPVSMGQFLLLAGTISASMNTNFLGR